MLNYRPDLLNLPVYDGEEQDWNIKVDANENPNNLPPLVLDRVLGRLAFQSFNRYPDMTMTGLREQIAAANNLPAANVLIGSGSSELLAALCYAFGGPGRKIMFPVPSFSMYTIYTKLAGSQPVPVELAADYALPVDTLLTTAHREAVNMIMLCNPNNPTGTLFSRAALERLIAGVDCPVVVDEAYYEFCGQTVLDLINKYPNLIITRTFSKAYGLAAARVGYLFAAAEVAEMVGRGLMPYHVNDLSLAAAEIVYQMRTEFDPYIRQIIEQRQYLTDQLAKVPESKVYPSGANFLLLKTAAADDLNKYLAGQGIGVRNFAAAQHLTGCLRISVGTPTENETVLRKINEFFKRG